MLSNPRSQSQRLRVSSYTWLLHRKYQFWFFFPTRQKTKKRGRRYKGKGNMEIFLWCIDEDIKWSEELKGSIFIKFAFCIHWKKNLIISVKVCKDHMIDPLISIEKSCWGVFSWKICRELAIFSLVSFKYFTHSLCLFKQQIQNKLWINREDQSNESTDIPGHT